MSPSSTALLIGLPGGDLDGFLSLLRQKAETFIYVLTNSTHAGLGRNEAIPGLVLAWLLATVLALPVLFGLSRLTGTSPEFGTVARVSLGTAFLQVLLFVGHWYIIAWGQRSLDLGLYGLTVLLGAVLVKWFFEAGLLQSLLYVLGQGVFTLLIVFILAFSAGQAGIIDF